MRWGSSEGMQSFLAIRPVSKGLVVVLTSFLVLACSGGGNDTSGDAVGSQTLTPTGGSAAVTATASPTVEQEILKAYMDYVEAYKRAVLELDPTYVEGFAAGAELESIRREIERLRSQGLALRVVLTHNPVVVERAETTAVILDEMVNNSFQVDAKTKDPPVASGSGEILRNSFRLEKVGGRWVVTQVFRNQ
jgi:hypothetical protein